MAGIIKINSPGLIFFLALVLSGCVETSMMYRGNTVSSVPVVTLQEDLPNAGTWETFDLVIDYEYIQDGDTLEIKGQVALGQHQQMVYDRLLHLYVYLFFLDENSRVLETVSLTSHMFGSSEVRQAVSRRYRMPTGTVAISFGYDGAVGDRDSRMSFYQLPLSK